MYGERKKNKYPCISRIYIEHIQSQMKKIKSFILSNRRLCILILYKFFYYADTAPYFHCQNQIIATHFTNFHLQRSFLFIHYVIPLLCILWKVVVHNPCTARLSTSEHEHYAVFEFVELYITICKNIINRFMNLILKQIKEID